MAKKRFGPGSTFYGDTPRSRTVLLLVLLLASIVMAQLGVMLRAMHQPGTRSAGVGDLASPLTGPREALEILTTWEGWDAGVGGTDRVTTDDVVIGWVILDTLLFAPALMLLVRGGAVARQRAVCAATAKARVEAAEAEGRRTAAADPSAGDAAVVHDDASAEAADAALVEVLAIAAWLAVLYLFFDWAENIFTIAALQAGPTDADVLPWVQATSAAKWAAVGLAVVPLLGSFVRDPRAIAESVHRWWPTVVTLRVQVVGSLGAVAVLLFLPGPVRPQLTDLFRDWGHHPARALFAVAAVVALSWVLWASGTETLARACDGRSTSQHVDWQRDAARRRRRGAMQLLDERWRLPLVGIAGLVLTVVGVAVLPDVRGIHSGALAVVLGGLMLLWTALSVPPRTRQLVNTREPLTERRGVLPLLTFLPSYALFLAWLRAEVTFGEWTDRAVVIVLSVGALVALWTWLHKRAIPGGMLLHWLIVGAVGATGVAVVVLARSSNDVAWQVGAVAMLLLWLAALVAVLCALEHLLWAPPRGTLAFARLRRFPLLGLLAALLVGTSLVSTEPGFHLVRVVGDKEDAGQPRAPLTGADAFDWWQRDAPDAGDVRPLLLVASSGGGGRAAYWTLLTLDCLFGTSPPRDDHVACADGGLDRTSTFAASGISGGSVGLAMFSAADGDIDADEVFDEGFIEPLLANLLATDLPNGLIHSPDWRDRAAALELVWEESVDGMDEPFDLPVGNAGEWEPLLLLNSAAIEDGCRVNVSALSLAVDRRTDDGVPPGLRGSCQTLRRFELSGVPPSDVGSLPATRDLRDLLCDDESIRLSTAALLSARFPYISPSGALEFCTDPDRFTFMVDGGTVDSSAASPLESVLDTVLPLVREHNESRADGDPCVQPVVLQLDNGYDDVTPSPPPGRPSELVAPASELFAAGNGAAATARQSLAEASSRLATDAGCDDLPRLPTWLHVTPSAHPGIQAPLGWSLSEPARDDLRNQFGRLGNQCALLVVRQWLSGEAGTQTCLGGTVRRPVACEPEGECGTEVAAGVPVALRDAGCEADLEAGCRSFATDSFGRYLAITDRDVAPLARTLVVGGQDAPCEVDGTDAVLVGCDVELAAAGPRVPAPPDALPARGVVAVVSIAALLAAALWPRKLRCREEVAATPRAPA